MVPTEIQYDPCNTLFDSIERCLNGTTANHYLEHENLDTVILYL